MEVEVEEDCTSTVTNTPIIKPTMGFFRRSESENKAPMFLPPRIRKESERNEREQMKKRVIIKFYNLSSSLYSRPQPVSEPIPNIFGSWERSTLPETK